MVHPERTLALFPSLRQQQILKAIVEDYVFTAEPVGSRALSRKFAFGLSPATLRNEMADLEEAGFLSQPHASAGRVPSDAGYRVFVDLLMEPAIEWPEAEMRVLERFQFDARDLHEILQQAAKVTAVLSQCTAIVRAPRLLKSRIHYLQLLPLNARDAMLVILTDQGAAMNQLVHLPESLSADDLVLLTNFLNAHLRQRSLDELTLGLLGELLNEMRAYENVLKALWARITEVGAGQERIFVSNTSFLAQQPEFGERDKIRSLLCLLEREQVLSSLLSLVDREKTPHSRVSIGHENALSDLHECSFVSATYTIGDKAAGEIGVLGPTRLEYAKALRSVETMARHLSTTLTRFFGGSANR